MSRKEGSTASSEAISAEDVAKPAPQVIPLASVPTQTTRRKPINVAMGLLFLIVAGVIALDLYSTGLNVSSEKQYEAIVKALIATISGYLSFYFLVSKHAHEIGIERIRHENQYMIEQLRGQIDRENTAESNMQKEILDTKLAIMQTQLQLWIKPELLKLEGKAAAAQKHADLVLEDDFRRRVRRDAALLEFSKQLNLTMRTFRALTSYKIESSAPAESLVNTLAAALTARQQFLLARDALDDLHVVHEDHEKVIFSFSETLMDIIIDVRRTDGADGQNLRKIMASHNAKLESFNKKMGTMLNFFLAPQQEPGDFER